MRTPLSLLPAPRALTGAWLLPALVLALATTSACDSSGGSTAPDTASADTAVADTAGADTSAEDAQQDTTPPDVGTDAGPDAGADAGTDAGTDVAADVEADAGPAAPTVTTDLYRTADQMLLANEINESGEPFAEALGYDLDQLDPMTPDVPDAKAYVLGIENYEYSRYQLGTVISRSGLGLHMMWAPKVTAQAAMQPDDFDGSMTGGAANGFKEDDMLMKMIGGFSTLSGHAPPGNPWPQFAEFESADPHLPQAIDAAKFGWEDFSTLRWDRTKMNKVLNPAALGQTMMKQYLWSQDMLSAFHDGDDNGVDPDGTNSPDLADSPEFDPNNNLFFGGDSLDGFIGLVLSAEAINKTALLTSALTYDGTSLGPVDLMTYDPQAGIRYFPHNITVTEAPTAVPDGAMPLPPHPDTFAVTDPASHLFDQASLLWATTSFAAMMDPNDDSSPAHWAYHEVFDGSPFPAAMSETGTPGPYDLMKGTSKLLWMNLQAMHRDPTSGVLVDTAQLADGAVTRGDTVSTIPSAYAIVALESLLTPFAGTPLEDPARAQIATQASFLVASLSDGNGRYLASAPVAPAADGPGSQGGDLAAQAAAVRALYVAARVTDDGTLRAAADAAYAVLTDDFYDDAAQVFADTPGAAQGTYTAATVALVAGALREAALEGGAADAADLYVAFFRRVSRAMQLSEGPNTGETGGDSDGDGISFIPEQPDNLPPVFASQAVFPL